MTNPESPTMNNEFIPLTPELSDELKATFEEKNPSVKYAVVCGDDRKQTRESQYTLQVAGIEQGDAQIRYFGGAAGLERVLGVALIASGQAEKLLELGETTAEAVRAVKAAIEATSNVTLELHTAEGNEGNSAQFNPESVQGVGCAYAANAAVVAEICAENEAHQVLTTEEQAQLYSGSSLAAAVYDANRQYKTIRYGNGATGLSRQDYQAIAAPVQVLEGQHAPAAETVVVINFTADRVSNPSKAHEIGTPFYNNDVTQVAEMLLRTYPQFNLDPELLLAVMDQDIRATRAALAHGAPEGAAALEVHRFGAPTEAIAYLKAL